MKLSDMVRSYASAPKLKAKLRQKIELDNGSVLEKGTVSVLLILKDDGKYHFECGDDACTVTKDEIEFISR